MLPYLALAGSLAFLRMAGHLSSAIIHDGQQGSAIAAIVVTKLELKGYSLTISKQMITPDMRTRWKLMMNMIS